MPTEDNAAEAAEQEPIPQVLRRAMNHIADGCTCPEKVARAALCGRFEPTRATASDARLAALSSGDDAEPVLRRFEVSLLAEIGYGLLVERDVIENRPLEDNRKYEYVIDRGPVPVSDNHSDGLVFFGSELLAMARGEFHNDGQLKSAKRLLRAVLKSNLGDRKLKTRAVLASMSRS